MNTNPTATEAPQTNVRFVPGSYWTRARARAANTLAFRRYETGGRQEMERWAGRYGDSHLGELSYLQPRESEVGRILVRRGSSSDVPNIQRLLAGANLPPLFVTEFAGGFVVAESDGVLLGAGGLEPYASSGIIRSVAIAPGARGRGLGRLLSGLLIDDARESGLRNLYLSAGNAAPFWEGLGFVDLPLDQWDPATHRAWQYRFFAEHCDFVQEIGLRTMWRPAIAVDAAA